MSKKLFSIQDMVSTQFRAITNIEILRLLCMIARFGWHILVHCYGLIKKSGDIYYISTKQKDRKILDENIKQIFMTTSLYSIGVSKITYHNFNILKYDLERLLIEIVRNKMSLDYEVYHEIINNYKRIKKLLNKTKLENYIKEFKNSKIL